MITTIKATDIARFLEQKRKERAMAVAGAEALMKNARAIDDELAALALAVDGKTVGSSPTAVARPKLSKAGKRVRGPSSVAKGELRSAVLELAATTNGKVTSKQASDLFDARGYKTNALVVLARMTDAGDLKRVERGVYERARKAKLVKA